MPASDDILRRLLALHPKRIDLTLDRVYRLLEKLGNPHQQLPPVVHIAGTNGKGSTQAFCAAIATAAGLRVHRYSSPHLVRFHERIILDNQWINEGSLSALLEECAQVQGDTPITFFEITTAAAFLAYARTPADILFLETGLGGRLDATNVVAKPACVQLSRIGIDHQEFLGSTIEAITAEKVAIARMGVPLIVGAQTETARSVITDYCATHNIPCAMMHRDWHYRILPSGEWLWWDATSQHTFPAPSLRGKHQYENAALAVATVKTLQSTFAIQETHITQGLQNTVWAGRMQLVDNGHFSSLLPEGVKLWVDGGHNLDAGGVLAECLQGLEAPRLVVGMLENKDCAGFLRCVEAYLDGAQSLDIPGTEAALSAAKIAAIRTEITPATGFTDAITRAVQTGGKNIVLCGSLYLIGAFLGEHHTA